MAYKRFSEEDRKKYREQQIEAAANRMNDYINQMKDTDKFKDFLKTTSKFHNYSMRNIVLIASQKPDARIVAGYNSWKNNFQRQVNKGTEAIKVIAPIIKKREHEKLDNDGRTIKDNNGLPIKEIKPTIVGYRTQNVFDISDTTGKELVTARDLIHNNLDQSNDYENIFKEFKKTLEEKHGLTINENTPFDDEILSKGAEGYFIKGQNVIGLDATNSYDMKFRTLIHEFAHYKLHSDNNSLETGVKELQAESAAYIVSDYYNLDTSDYSVGYAATWTGKEKNVLINYLSDIKEFASETIEIINTMPQFEMYISKKQSEFLSKEDETSINKMIDNNLKNGFDKVSLIKNNLETKYDMKNENNKFENENFKVTIDYDGYNVSNPFDNCKIEVTNKNTDTIKNYDFTQLYEKNNLSNSSQITVIDNNNKDKKYIHERDYDGNIKDKNFKELSNEDQLLYFENFIDKSIKDNGIIATKVILTNDAKKMGYEIKNDFSNEDSLEISTTLIRKDEKNDNPFNNKESKININILTDSSNNHHANFKMENAKGIVNKDFMESDDTLNNNVNTFLKNKNENKKQIEI